MAGKAPVAPPQKGKRKPFKCGFHCTLDVRSAFLVTITKDSGKDDSQDIALLLRDVV